MVYHAHRYGKLGWYVFEVSNPVGWVLGVVELGVELWLCGRIHKFWLSSRHQATLDRQFSIHLAQLSEHLRRVRDPSIGDSQLKFTERQANREIAGLTATVQQYLQNLSLSELAEIQLQYLKKEGEIDRQYGQAAYWNPQFKVIHPGAAPMTLAYLQRTDDNGSEFQKMYQAEARQIASERTSSQLMGLAMLANREVENLLQPYRNELQTESSPENPLGHPISVESTLALLNARERLAEFALNEITYRVLKTENTEETLAFWKNLQETSGHYINPMPRSTPEEIFRALFLWIRKQDQKATHPHQRTLLASLSAAMVATLQKWCQNIESLSRVEVNEHAQTTRSQTYPIAVEQGFMHSWGFPGLENLFEPDSSDPSWIPYSTWEKLPPGAGEDIYLGSMYLKTTNDERERERKIQRLNEKTDSIVLPSYFRDRADVANAENILINQLILLRAKKILETALSGRTTIKQLKNLGSVERQTLIHHLYSPSMGAARLTVTSDPRFRGQMLLIELSSGRHLERRQVAITNTPDINAANPLSWFATDLDATETIANSGLIIQQFAIVPGMKNIGSRTAVRHVGNVLIDQELVDVVVEMLVAILSER